MFILLISCTFLLHASHLLIWMPWKVHFFFKNVHFYTFGFFPNFKFGFANLLVDMFEGMLVFILFSFLIYLFFLFLREVSFHPPSKCATTPFHVITYQAILPSYAITLHEPLHVIPLFMPLHVASHSPCVITCKLTYFHIVHIPYTCVSLFVHMHLENMFLI